MEPQGSGVEFGEREMEMELMIQPRKWRGMGGERNENGADDTPGVSPVPCARGSEPKGGREEERELARNRGSTHQLAT